MRLRLQIGVVLVLLLDLTRAVAGGLPKDVAVFIERRELCDHLRGEDIREDSRMEAMNKSCAGTDRELARLKEKYRDHERILERLSAFEEDIEADDPCDGLVPDRLLELLRTRYPGSAVITSSMLHPTNRQMFEAAHGWTCPGAARLDFFGRRHSQYGIALIDPAEQQMRLVVATQQRGRWRIHELDVIHATGVPALYAMPPGVYRSYDSNRRLNARDEVLALEWYESSAVVYIWNGSAAEKVWISD